MRAFFLGTADGHTSPRRDHSGVLLQTDEATMLLDCGAVAGRILMSKKFESHVPDLLWISHMHSDHVGQLGSLIQSLWLRTRRAPLHVFGPEHVLNDVRGWWEKVLLFPELIGFPVEWHPVTPGVTFTHGPFTMTPFATEHLTVLATFFKANHPATCFDCYGVVIDYKEKRYVYSSDLAKPVELTPALKDGRVESLIVELTHFPERELFAELAKYDIGQVWVTHYPDHLARRQTELRQMAEQEGFKGVVNLVRDRVARTL